MPAGTGQRAGFESQSSVEFDARLPQQDTIPYPPVAVVRSSELTTPRHISWWQNLQSPLLLALAMVHPQLLAVFLSLLSYSFWFLGSPVGQVYRRSLVHEAAS